jgi:hypothetical protein
MPSVHYQPHDVGLGHVWQLLAEDVLEANQSNLWNIFMVGELVIM